MLQEGGATRFSRDTSIQIRHGFVQKVYGLVGSQLLMTAVVAFGIFKLGVGFLRHHESLVMGLMLLSLVISISMMCIFVCRPGLLRKYPENYVILFFFTLAESIVVGLISVQFTQESVIMALGITTFLVFALTLFACQTSVDFTGCGPYLFMGMMCLCVFGFFIWLAGFFVSSAAFKTAHLMYACLGAFLFSCFIVFDTQLIVGGKHGRANEFSIDDYVPAAINLYIDIIQLFIYLLRIIGDRR